jgi:hypothetical protein
MGRMAGSGGVMFLLLAGYHGLCGDKIGLLCEYSRVLPVVAPGSRRDSSGRVRMVLTVRVKHLLMMKHHPLATL